MFFFQGALEECKKAISFHELKALLTDVSSVRLYQCVCVCACVYTRVLCDETDLSERMEPVIRDSCRHSCRTRTHSHSHTDTHSYTDSHRLTHTLTHTHTLQGLQSLCTLHHPHLLNAVLREQQAAQY